MNYRYFPYIILSIVSCYLGSCDSSSANKNKQAPTFIDYRFEKPDPNKDVMIPSFSMSYLSPFYSKLSALKSKKIKKVRILQFGDSHTACDWLSGELRNLLAKRFGNGGPGFIYAGRPWKWHNHSLFKIKIPEPIEDPEKKNRSFLSQWLYDYFNFDFDRDIYQKLNDLEGKGPYKWKHYRNIANKKIGSKGIYGLGGVKTIAYNGETTIICRNSYFNHLEIWYLKQPSGGSIQLKVGSATEPKHIETHSYKKQNTRTIFRFSKPNNMLKLNVSNSKPVTLFGLVMENNKAGIVLDTLGIDGAKVKNLLNQDWNNTLAAHINWRNADLIILAYGSNSLEDKKITPRIFKMQLTQLIQKIRKTSKNNIPILLLGPPDRNWNVSNSEDQVIWSTPDKLKKLIQSMIDVSKSQKVAFINQYALMGGDGSMDRFFNERLAQKDHLHLNKKGYKLLAKEIFKELFRFYSLYK